MKQKKKITIASNLQLVNNLELLTAHPEFDLQGGPIAQWINGELNTNFDYFLDIGLVDSDDLSLMLGDKYINFCRHPKREQVLRLANAGLNVPETAFPISFTHNERIDHNTYTACAVALTNDVNSEFVVKSNNGARGMGQALVTMDNFAAFSNMYLGKAGGGLPKESDIAKLGASDDDKDLPLHTHSLCGSNDILISKRVEIAAEYRILFGYDTGLIIEKREVNKQNGWQARGGNGDVVYSGKLGKLTPDVFEDRVSKEELKEFTKKLASFIMVLGYPFGSMDLYIETSGVMGVIEYCPQFAHAGISPVLTQKLIVDGLKARIKAIAIDRA